MNDQNEVSWRVRGIYLNSLGTGQRTLRSMLGCPDWKKRSLCWYDCQARVSR